MAKNKKEIPVKAMHFEGDSNTAFVSFSEDQAPSLDMLAYSGGMIKDHWYWGNLVIDLEGMKFSKKKYPILEDHDTEKKIGFTENFIIDNGQLRADPKTTVLLDTPEAKQFIENSSKGFPYQSSIYAVPSSIEEIEDETKFAVNGFVFNGPAKVWRESTLKESSVCVFGHDSDTESSVKMAEVQVEYYGGGQALSETTNNKKEVKDKMNIETLKSEHPEIITKVQSEIAEQFTEEIAKIKEELKSAMAQIEEKDQAILAFEKKEVVRTEQERKDSAERIWSDKLSESSVPKHMHDKVRKHVSYMQFVSDDGFDVEKFTKTVEGEIEDWEKLGVTETVMGSGFTKRESTEDKDKMADDSVAIADNLLKIAGVI